MQKSISLEEYINQRWNCQSWSRRKIFGAWVGLGIISMLPTAIISDIWVSVSNFVTFDEKLSVFILFFSYLLSVPIGWLFHLPTPLGVISLISLYLALRKKRPIHLIWSTIPCAVAGFIWPVLIEGAGRI